MDDAIRVVIVLGIMMFIFAVIAGVQGMLSPVFEGTGNQIASATGVSASNGTNITKNMYTGTVQAQGNVYTLLPYVGLGFGFIGLIFGKNFIKGLVGGYTKKLKAD